MANFRINHLDLVLFEKKRCMQDKHNEILKTQFSVDDVGDIFEKYLPCFHILLSFLLSIDKTKLYRTLLIYYSLFYRSSTSVSLIAKAIQERVFS